MLENPIRGSLRTLGLKVGVTSAEGFEGRVRELIVTHPSLLTVMVPYGLCWAHLKVGDAMLRSILYEAGHTLLPHTRSMWVDGPEHQWGAPPSSV